MQSFNQPQILSEKWSEMDSDGEQCQRLSRWRLIHICLLEWELNIKTAAKHLETRCQCCILLCLCVFAVLVNLHCGKMCTEHDGSQGREMLAVALVLQLVALTAPVMLFRIHVVAAPPSSLLLRGGCFKQKWRNKEQWNSQLHFSVGVLLRDKVAWPWKGLNSWSASILCYHFENFNNSGQKGDSKGDFSKRSSINFGTTRKTRQRYNCRVIRVFSMVLVDSRGFPPCTLCPFLIFKQKGEGRQNMRKINILLKKKKKRSLQTHRNVWGNSETCCIEGALHSSTGVLWGVWCKPQWGLQVQPGSVYPGLGSWDVPDLDIVSFKKKKKNLSLLLVCFNISIVLIIYNVLQYTH